VQQAAARQAVLKATYAEKAKKAALREVVAKAVKLKHLYVYTSVRVYIDIWADIVEVFLFLQPKVEVSAAPLA